MLNTQKNNSFKFATVGVQIDPSMNGFIYHVYIVKRGPEHPFLFGARTIKDLQPGYAEMVAIMEATKWAIDKNFKKLIIGDNFDRRIIDDNLKTEYGQKFLAFMNKAEKYCKVVAHKTAYNN